MFTFIARLLETAMILLRRLSVQSRLVVLLLLVSISSILVVAAVSYYSATEALTQRAYSRLEGLRQARAARVQDRLDLMRYQVITLSETESVVQACKDFRQAYTKLDKKELTPEQLTKLRASYEKEFLPGLKKQTDGDPVLDTYFPVQSHSRYLQFHYLTANPYPLGERYKFDAASDGSDYSKVHARHHIFFRRFASRFGFQDILLIDPDTGEVLYTCEKTTELGRNINSGPYMRSNLAELARSLSKQSDRKTFRIADFESYLPNMGQPAAFVASPVFDGPDRVALLVLQFPIEIINRITTGGKEWKRDGLEETGEVYLVGPDRTLRSMPRPMIEDAEAYYHTLRHAGHSPSTIDHIRQAGSAVLLQPVRGKAVEEALLGRDGMISTSDYRGHRVLASYGPLSADGLHWVIVAQMDVSEVYAPVGQLGRRVVLALVVVALVVSLLAVVLARLFVQPIRQISAGVRAVSAGQLGEIILIDSQDEFRDLADAFNAMTRNLHATSERLEQKIQENEDLLSNLLPGKAAARLREGEPQTADSYADVAVLCADLVGYAELNTQTPDGDAIDRLNELIGTFDELTDRFGVEKLRCNGTTYLAVCGLSVPRIDQANRMVEFAQELLRVVGRFNDQHGTKLSLRIGVHCGPVVGGVIGRSKFSYELWGATVKIAHDLKVQGRLNTITLSPAVHERLGDLYEFESQPAIQTPEKQTLAVWSVKAA